MYAEERQQAIATQVDRRGRVSVNQLADEFAVTTETVRRDLSLLERSGLLRRVHGGAVPANALSALETAVSDRDQAQTAEKDRIAQAAVDLLPGRGGSLILDAGTTTARVAALLPTDADLLVATNSVPIASRLAGSPGLELHLLPGRVRRATHAAVGSVTVEAIDALHVDVAFVGSNGITVRHGLSTPDHSEAAGKRAMVRAAERVVALADSSKLGVERTVRFAALADIDVLVTDRNAPRDTVRELRDHGLEVVVA